jgi:hypothetical protein
MIAEKLSMAQHFHWPAIEIHRKIFRHEMSQFGRNFPAEGRGPESFSQSANFLIDATV